jgi:hypothetical protein
MTNGHMRRAEIEAILAGDQEDVNRYLVTTMAEMIATCRNRPAECAAARSQQWSGRRTLTAWGLAIIVSLLSITSMVVTLTGGQ